MPNRHFTSADRYRYGFNGKENDNEAVSTGEGTQDYGFRIYNPSLGKFLSVDPISAQYPELTPYQFAGNSPIANSDLDGLEPKSEIWKTGSTEPLIKLMPSSTLQYTLPANAIIHKVPDYVPEKSVTKPYAAAITKEFDRNSKMSSKTFQIKHGEMKMRLPPPPASGAIHGLYIEEMFVAPFAGLARSAVTEGLFFRGTTEGYAGSRAAQAVGYTPTSTSPAVATVFAQESAQFGEAVVQIATEAEMQGVQRGTNVLSAMEKEVGFNMSPTSFAQSAGGQISLAESRSILSNMGVNIPKNVTKSNMSEVISNLPNLSTKQINTYYQEAQKIMSQTSVTH